MADKFEIVTSSEGYVGLGDRELSDREKGSSIVVIRQAIKDPSISLGDLKRMIAYEIAVATEMMIRQGDNIDVTQFGTTKALESQVRALRELGKELMESDQMAKRDYINLDGPKFQYVSDMWVSKFKIAMKKAGVEDGQAKNILMHYKDEMAAVDPEIRREVQKIDSSYYGKE
jgi:hypothetical protein